MTAAPTSVRDRARRFLLERCVDGHWTDFDLPPGPSDAWVTAHTLHALATSGTPRDTDLGEEVRQALDAGAQWLSRQQGADGGWGYNAHTGSDADSTAWAILALTATGHDPGEDACRCLLGFQAEDGGFCTYGPGRDGWSLPHADVTPTALLALQARRRWSARHQVQADPGIREAVRDAEAAVRRGQAPSGLWNSYWWPSPLYATAFSLRALRGLQTPSIVFPSADSFRAIRLPNPFELALWAECLAQVVPGGDPRRRQVRHALEHALSADGGWAASPILRLTYPDRHTPWDDEDPGPLYADEGRIFVTATGLRTLHTLDPDA